MSWLSKKRYPIPYELWWVPLVAYGAVTVLSILILWVFLCIPPI